MLVRCHPDRLRFLTCSYCLGRGLLSLSNAKFRGLVLAITFANTLELEKFASSGRKGTIDF